MNREQYSSFKAKPTHQQDNESTNGTNKLELDSILASSQRRRYLKSIQESTEKLA